MKKLLAIVLTLSMLLCACAALAAEGPFTPGEDTAEYAMEGASGWTTETVFVKIAAGEDVLFNGTVTLTSDTVFAGEFIWAAVCEMGLSSEGIQEGFITAIGDYASGADADGNYIYWGYEVNGKYAPVAVNQLHVLDGDYIDVKLMSYNADAGFAAEVKPCGYDAPFAPGEDTAEYAVDGASGWTVETVYVKISAGDDVLFNGSVTLTSDTILASEATWAAIVEQGISSEGVLEGFITSIGDYVSGSDAEGNYIYWGYSVNGKNVPLGCNEMTVLDGDYIEWTFQTMAW